MATEITLRIVGQADTSQIEAVKAKVAEIGPALVDALEQVNRAAAELRTKLDGVGDSAEDAGKKGASGAGALSGALKAVHPAAIAAAAGIAAVVIGVGQLSGAVSSFISSGVQINAQFETFETQLTTLMGSAEGARREMAALSDFAASTPFELPQIVQADKVLIGFGLTGNNVMRKFGTDLATLRTSIGDMAAGTGADFAELANTWGKFSAGATGEAISRLQEMGIVTREQLQGMGVEFSKSGQLTSPLPQALQSAMQIANDKFGGGMEKLSQTFEGQMSTLSDNWNNVKRVVSEPIFDVAKDGLAALNGILSDPALQGALESIALLIGDKLRSGIEFAKGALDSFVSAGGLETLKNAASTVAAGLLLLWDAAKAVGQWMLEHQEVIKAVGVAFGVLAGVLAGAVMIAIGLVVAGLAMIAAVVAAPIAAVVLLAQKWREGSDEISAATSETAGYLQSTWASIVQAVTGAVHSLWDMVVEAWNTGTEAVKGYAQDLWDFLVSTWESIRAAVTSAASALLTWLANAWQTFTTWIYGLLNRLAEGFRKAWEWVGRVVSGAVKALVEWVAGAWRRLGEWIASWLNSLGEAFSKAWNWIGTTVSDIAGRIANFLASVFHKVAQTIAEIWDKLQDAFLAAWNAIIGIFKSAAKPIIDGMVGLFKGIVNVARKGMTAMGGVVESVLSGIVKYVTSFVASLGPLGGPLANLVSGLGEGVSGFMSSLGGKFEGIISGIGEGLNNVTSAFGSKISAARERVSSLFGGGPRDLASEAGRFSLGGGGGPGVDVTGAGLDLGALAGGGAGGGGQGPLNVGDSGSDRMGDFYIDENGQKVYTSGAGLARQEAKERARDAKEAERAAKAAARQGRAAKAAGPSAAERANNLAKEMSDVATKVATAVQAGLDAIADLRDADIPGRDVWEPRLIALQDFVGAALARFQDLGKGLLTEVGKAEDGTALLDTANSEMATAAADLASSTIDAVSKTSNFLQTLVRAKFPPQDKIDAAFDLISGLLGRIQARAMELAAVFPPGEEGKEGPAQAFAAAGQGLSVWAEAWGRIADIALVVSDKSVDLARVPPAMAIVEGVMGQIAAAGARLVDGLRAAIPDALDQEDALTISRLVAATMAAWVDVVGQVGAAADGLMKLVRVPDVSAQVEVFFGMIQRVGGAIVQGLQRAIPNAGARDAALELSASVAATLNAWVIPVANMANTALALRRVTSIPTGAAEAIGRFWSEISQIAGAIYRDLANAIPDPADQLEALGVSQALSAALAASVGVVSATAASIKSLESLADIPADAVDRVRAFLGQVVAMLAGFVRGPGYDLLADTKKTLEDFAVVQTLIGVMQGGVALIGQIAGIGKTLAESEPVNAAQVDQAIANAGMIRDKVTAAAEAYLAGLEAAGKLWEDVTEQVGIYAGILKDTIGAFATAAALKVGEILPIDPTAVDTALVNAFIVAGKVQQWAEAWVKLVKIARGKVETVAQEVKDYAAYVRDALGLFDAAAKIGIGEIEPIDGSKVDVSIANADLIAGKVAAWAAAWVAAVVAARGKVATVIAEVKDYATVVQDALGIVSAAVGLVVEGVKPISVTLLDLAMQNVGLVLSTVDMWAARWVVWIAEGGRKLEDVIASLSSYAEAVKTAVDTVMAGVALAFTNVKALTISDLDVALSNIGLVLVTVQGAAEEWAKRLREAGRKMEAVVAETDSFSKVAISALSLLEKVTTVIDGFVTRGTRFVDISRIMPAVRRQIVTIVSEMAAAFDEIQAEGDRLKKAGDLAAILGPAGDALSRALEALTLENLLKSPLIDPKMRSGFMSRVAATRMEALGKQIADGIRRTIQALVDGLKGVTIPDGLGDGLERIVSVYERVVTVLERIKGAAIDPGTIQALAAALRDLVSIPALGGPSTAPTGGQAGIPTDKPGRREVGRPGVTVGNTTAEDVLRGLLAAVVNPRQPDDINPNRRSWGSAPPPVTINATIPVMLNTEQIGAAIQKTIHQQAAQNVMAPQGI